jgi:peroxiredoxin
MSNLKNGEMAPEIELRDTDGEVWRLSDYRGKMVCIHTCRGEF